MKFFTVNKTWSPPSNPRLINNCHLSPNLLLSPTFCKSPKALTLFLILLFKVWDQTLSRRRGLILWTIATFFYLKKIYILSRKYSCRQIKSKLCDTPFIFWFFSLPLHLLSCSSVYSSNLISLRPFPTF